MIASRSAATAYRVAGRVVTTNLAVGELSPLEVPGASLDEPPPAAEPGELRRASSLIFAGEAWVVDRDRPVECRLDAHAYRLRVGGAGSFWVALDGRSLGCSKIDAEGGGQLARLALVGPALTLALALQGTFCLHASGVETAAGVFAFAGDSGAGKSTLARLLEASPELGWRRVADDVLPVEPGDGRRPAARPDFPQLKLAAGEQPWLSGRSSLPLAAVFLLRPPSRKTRLARASARSAMLAHVRHTVAARLFDARLLDRHLGFAASLAERVPTYRLSYPWSPQSLPAVARALADLDLG